MIPVATANLGFLKRFSLIAHLLVFLSVLGFAYAEFNPTTMILGTAGIALAWWLVEMPGTRPLPRWLINIGVISASLLLFWELVIAGHDNLLLALGHFMVAILVCKLFEKKGDRDYAQILTLTLLIMVAGSIFSSSLVFALILAAYLLLGLYGMLVFHLRFETQRALERKLVPTEAALLADGHGTLRRDIRSISLVCGGAILLISALVFAIFPRSRAHEFLSTWAIAGPVRTGASENIAFTDYGRIQQSNVVVMEVRVEQNGMNVGSESYQPYFRGKTLDAYAYDERLRTYVWTRSPYTALSDSTDKLLGSVPAELVDPQSYSSVGLVHQHYTLFMSSGNMLFAVTPPVRIASEQLRSVGYSSRDYWLAAGGLPMLPFQYTVSSAMVYSADLSREKPFVRRGDLRSPNAAPDSSSTSVPEPVVRIARQVAAELLPPDGQNITPDRVRPIAERFEQWLRKTYPYTLDNRIVDRDIDPTEDFLVNRTQSGGHCEYFASSMVMMCRSMGINSRIVTGFHGGEFNSVGGYYVVRGKYAHAWVEVFVPNRGWVLFDPTPTHAETASSVSAWTRWFQDIGEVIQKSWLNSIVSFDNTSRKYIFVHIASVFSSITGTIRERFADVIEGTAALFGSRSVALSVRITAFLSIGLMLGAAVWLARRIHRRRHSQVALLLRRVDRKTQKQFAHDLLFFDDLLRVLSRTGQRKLPEQTPREYVDRLAPVLKTAAADARWLVSTFYDIRYGTIPVTPKLREQIAQALLRLRIGAVHPAA